jgi:uroporphyrinogen-III synthase
MLGNVPVAAVFAREITPGLTSLVKKLEQTTADSSTKVGAFVVLMTDDEKAEAKLKELAEKEDLKKVVLLLDNPAGPSDYKIAKEADVTVLLYEKKEVKKNFAFEKGKFTDKEADKIAAARKELTKSEK